MSTEDAPRGVSRSVLLVAAAALAAGFAAVPIALGTERDVTPEIWAVFGPLVGWSFIGAGLYAWLRPPSRRFGALMIATGFTWYLGAVGLLHGSLAWALGVPIGSVWLAVLAHALLAFPSGRLTSRPAQVVAIAFYAVVVGHLTLVLLITPDPVDDFDCKDCPGENPLAIVDGKGVADILVPLRAPLFVVVFGALFGLLARRWRRSSPRERRSLAPIYLVGVVLAAEVVLLALLSAAGASAERAVEAAINGTVAAVPFAFLAGLARSHLYRTSAVAGLVRRLGGRPGGEELRDGLAQALDDPSLELAFWLGEVERYVDADGHTVELPAEGSGRASTSIERDGRRVAALIHDEALLGEPELVRGVGAAASLALENERLEAELHVRLDELHSSRARLMSASDDERRRLERDLHDGAQQRFVVLALRLRLVRAQLADDAPPALLLDEAIEELAVGMKELRELARGIHPAVLSDQGLEAALKGLMARTPVPVTLLAMPEGRLPPPVETAAYFLIAEALTNVAKYAEATRATVSVVRDNGSAVVEVSDDGVGGADPAGGSGLRGLSDRIAALNGDLEVESPPGAGTRLRARLPVG